MPRSALIAGLLGALTLFAIVVGAYVVTADADSAEACRRGRSCGYEQQERNNNNGCMSPVGVSTLNGCEENDRCQVDDGQLDDECCVSVGTFGFDPCEPTGCIEGLQECCQVGDVSIQLNEGCCEVVPASHLDPCYEEPTCTTSIEDCCDIQSDQVQTSDLCTPVCERSEQSQCCETQVASANTLNGCCDYTITSGYNPCCEAVNLQTASYCEPRCDRVLSLSSDGYGCGCGFPSGFNTSNFGCEPREDRCELRSFRRLGRWPVQECNLPL